MRKYIRTLCKWLGVCNGCATDRIYAELAILRTMLREERRQKALALDEIRELRNEVFGVPDAMPRHGGKDDVQ